MTTAASSLPLLVVTIGTDPHRFDRLMGWIDRWLADHDDVRAVIQHSTSPPPGRGTTAAYLPSRELQGLLDKASIVVCHGGTVISECRRLGVVPVVVPRRCHLREAVDDHQLWFARRLAASGLVACCETETELREELTRRLTDVRSVGRVSGRRQAPAPPPGIERAARELDRLVRIGRRRPARAAERREHEGTPR